MRRVLVAGVCVVVMAAAGIASAQSDTKGSADHPLLTRMPGFHISGYNAKDFDRFEFIVQDGPKTTRVPIEGRKTYIQYNLIKGEPQPGELKVVKNVINALAKVGGKVQFENRNSATVKVEKDGKETWVYVIAFPTLYRLNIVEREAMEQVIEANAEAMGNDLRTTGHVAVYGIYFDTAKSDVKPESEAAIAEIVKLLQADAALKLHVVGHTDSTGSFDSNMTLSKERAAAVIGALVGKGIAASRLKAHGVGSLSPVASNKTEEGKAENRRVELVEQ